MSVGVEGWIWAIQKAERGVLASFENRDALYPRNVAIGFLEECTIPSTPHLI
jgi:hypothetical protein